jgi:hypothetical protein
LSLRLVLALLINVGRRTCGIDGLTSPQAPLSYAEIRIDQSEIEKRLMVFLEGFSKLLLFLHSVAAFVLAGCLAHNLLIVTAYWRGNFRKKNLEKLHVKIALPAYAATFTVGALVYPTFGVRVRYEYFDENLIGAISVIVVLGCMAYLALHEFAEWGIL